KFRRDETRVLNDTTLQKQAHAAPFDDILISVVFYAAGKRRLVVGAYHQIFSLETYLTRWRLTTRPAYYPTQQKRGALESFTSRATLTPVRLTGCVEMMLHRYTWRPAATIR
ncbi:unnamed protein product, partial [Ectocarpus sp. 12 AP-2014]